jgi:hypothetical protein
MSQGAAAQQLMMRVLKLNITQPVCSKLLQKIAK